MAQSLDRHNKADKKEELVEKLVFVNRVAKTVKGGRTMSFAALVVVGDQKGRIGFGSGKASEVPEAIVKATNEAKKNMVRIPLREGRTLHHDITGRFGAGKVVLRTAPAGTGVIAGGPMRAVFECLGVQDIVSKSIGTNNPYNMILATFDALKSILNEGKIYVFLTIHDKKNHNAIITIIVVIENIYLLLIIEFFIRKLPANTFA